MEDYRIANLEVWNRLVYAKEKSIFRRILEKAPCASARKGRQGRPQKGFQDSIMKALEGRTAVKDLGAVGLVRDIGGWGWWTGEFVVGIAVRSERACRDPILVLARGEASI